MNEITILAVMAFAFIVLIVSPGPNFLVISQISCTQSRGQGIFTGLGVASGSITWAILATTSLGMIFQYFPFLQPTLQAIGGCYLCYIGYNTLKGAGNIPTPKDISSMGIDTVLGAYRFGYLTNMSNPKAMAFYTSIFTTITATGLPLWVRYSGIVIIGVLAITWFVALATFFSIPTIQDKYKKSKTTIDLLSGILMCIFGSNLITNVFTGLI